MEHKEKVENLYLSDDASAEEMADSLKELPEALKVEDFLRRQNIRIFGWEKGKEIQSFYTPFPHKDEQGIWLYDFWRI